MNFVGAESFGISECHRIEPELRAAVIAPHMHMCRFVAVHAEERKTIGTYNRERGHCDNYTAFLCEAHVAKQNRMRLISLRLPASDIDRAKKQASARGIGYQTLIRMIVHEALQDKKPRRART